MALITTSVAIDPGTEYTRIYKAGKGLVLSEPSVCAVSVAEAGQVCYGTAALELLGRAPGKMTASSPISDGVISEVKLTSDMLADFVDRAMGKSFIRRMQAVVCVPANATELEASAMEEAVKNAGAFRVKLIEKPLAAAIGAGLPVNQCRGSMICDIGAGTADVAILSCGGVVTSRSVNTAGRAMDQSLIRLLRETRGIVIGERTAEKLKCELACAVDPPERTVTVRGRSMSTGLPASCEVSSKEVCLAVRPMIQNILLAISETLSDTPPELAGDLLDSGITLTGGVARMEGLAASVAEVTGLNVTVADDPELCAVVGAGRAIEHMTDARITFPSLPALPMRASADF